MDVYLNGARLISGDDYNATSGNIVGLTTYAINGDVLELVAYKAFNVADVTNAAANFNVGQTLSVDGDATITGNLTVTGDTTLAAGTSVAYATTAFELGSGVINITNSTQSTSSGTGALVVSGGVGIAESMTVGGDAIFENDVSIGGTLSYQDVTNIDSVGLVTARTGVRITAGGLVVTAGVATVGSAITMGGGYVTATNFVGSGANLTGVISGIEAKAAGSSVGTGITVVNWQAGATVVGDSTAGIATVTIVIPAGWNELDAALFN